MTRNERLSYLAGLIDGEGTVGITRRRPTGQNLTEEERSRYYYSPFVIVVNTDKRLVDIAKEIMGKGSIWCTKPQKENWNAIWRYEAVALTARELIALVQPYLIAKATQAELALSMPTRKKAGLKYGNGENFRRNEYLYEQQKQCWLAMTELNRRGVKKEVPLQAFSTT